jgi:predicted dehydrogenase
VHRVPDGVAPESAALIQLGVICGQGIDKAGIRPGEPVVVVGSGLIGLLAQRLAAAAGGGPAAVIANSRQKQRAARTGGATRFLLSADRDEVAALGAPVVVEATGDPNALAVAVAAAGEGGRVVLLGSARGATGAIPHGEIRRKGLHVVGAHVETLRAEARDTSADLHRRQGDRFLALLEAGRLAVADLVELEVDPRDADAFYRDLARRRDLVSARFDWTRLPPEQRVRQARVLRVPDLRARGSDAVKAPLPARVAAPVVPDRALAAARVLRIGLVGCGDIAVHNAAAVAGAPNATLTACFDPVRALADGLAAEWGCEAEPSVEALLDRPDVDAVFLAVPHHLHAPLAVQAAEAGKHVIVEKPMANDLASALEMAAVAERAGIVLSICLPHRYDPTVMATRRLIAAGAIGDPRGTRTTFFEDKPASYWLGGFSGRSVSSWRSSRAQAGGGLLIMNLSHLVDLARYLTGVEVESVSAVCDSADGPAEVEDTISATVRYANGGVGTLSGSAALRGNRGRSDELHVWGPDGYLEVEPASRVYTTRAVDGIVSGRWQTLTGLPQVNIRQEYVTHLAGAIGAGTAPDVTAADGIALQAFIEAAYRSSDTGDVVRPASLLPGADAGKREAA